VIAHNADDSESRRHNHASGGTNARMLIDELKRQPIPLQRSIIFGRYAQDKSGMWRNIIATLPVDLQHSGAQEPLVSCHRLGLLTRNYYVSQKALAPLSANSGAAEVEDDIRVRQGIGSSLLTVDEAIRPHGLRLLIMSGYRHPDLQRRIIATATDERGVDFAKGMFSDPDVYSPHASGGAVDLELWDDNAARLVPTKLAERIDRVSLELESTLTGEAAVVRENRRLIHHLLATPVILSPDLLFIPHPFEYWHYGRHERLSAFFASEEGQTHPVYYDEIR
jgi:D-alanyl-D-alanine dipeptidase